MNLNQTRQFLRIARAIQAVARIGTRSSGGELKYTIRFDNWFSKDEPEPEEQH